MAPGHVHELRIAPCNPYGKRVADRPNDEAGDPKTQAEPDRARQRPVDDGERPRRAAEQNRLGQRPVDGGIETCCVLHQTSAPPPNEKNDRKKLDAAKAMLRPNTIWILSLIHISEPTRPY